MLKNSYSHEKEGSFFFLKMKKPTIILLLVLSVIDPSYAHGHAHESDFTLPPQWELFEYGDQTKHLLRNDQDKTSDLLALCRTSTGKDATTCDNVTSPCIKDCSEKRLEALKLAKDKVRGLIDSLQDPLKTGLRWAILGLCSLGGLYLILKRHYRWVNLPLIGNWLMDDPTHGIKFRHYRWMRWIILGNSNIHWKTYMKEDAFVYNWTSLTQQPLNRPPTPEDVHQDEHGDRPVWTIEDILREKGLKMEDTEANGELNEGWEAVVREHVLRRKSRKHKKDGSPKKVSADSGGGPEITQTETIHGGLRTELSDSHRPKKTEGEGLVQHSEPTMPHSHTHDNHTHAHKSKDTKKHGEKSENVLYQEVLDEYWERIYEWSWHRYRNIPEYARQEGVEKEMNGDEG